MSDPKTTPVIVGYVRSPFTPAMKGELKGVRADDLTAQVIRALLAKTGVNPDLIEDLKLGNAFPEGEQGLNLAKNVAFLANLPNSVSGVTTNRFCGSSMQTLIDAANAIKAGEAEAIIAAGVESMSRIPMGGFNPSPNPELLERYPQAYISMGTTAENVAKKYNVSRDQQEKLALESHSKASKAFKEGLFRDEIVEITTKSGKKVTQDGCIRPDTTKEKLQKLKPAFDKAGTVTPGTSSPLTDGAVALMVVSEEFANKHNLPIMAKVKSSATVGCAPELMGMGPVDAAKKAMKKAGISMKDIDVIEINEAFGSQSVACMSKLGMDWKKVNKDGGAISMGHPLGASGARISGKAAQILQREGGKYALATMCIGGGQGIAVVLENPNAGKAANDVAKKATKKAAPKK